MQQLRSLPAIAEHVYQIKANFVGKVSDNDHLFVKLGFHIGLHRIRLVADSRHHIVDGIHAWYMHDSGDLLWVAHITCYRPTVALALAVYDRGELRMFILLLAKIPI